MSIRIALIALVVGAAAGPALADDPEYLSSWRAQLAGHTREVAGTVGTTVDYRVLRGASNPASYWRTLLAQLAEAPAPRNRPEELALWINAYNILAIDTVLRGYPVESIRDIGSFFRSVWKHEAGTVAGRVVSLHEIEHEILRKLGEPRIHAAIVCASTSCPSLRRTPFTAAGIDAELDDAMHRWLASPTKGLRVDRAANQITVSRIFDWFEEDFEPIGGVRAVISRYAPDSDRAWLAAHAGNASLDHFDYDWSLNDVR